MTSLLKKAALAFVTIGCAVASAETRLQGGGATFPNPLYQRWIKEYQKSHPDVQIDYQSIGSGGGIKGITDKTFDFAGSDAPMGKKEIAAAKEPLVHIPTAAGAVVLAYNIPNFKGDLKLDGETIADIYRGKITKWNDDKLKALNPDANLPADPITPVYRTDGSGTTFIYTNYVCTQSEDFKGEIGAGKEVKWPVGQGGKGNEGVTAVVQQTPGSIGYIELNYALANKIPFALLKNKDGEFVKASPQTVANAGEGAVDALSKSLTASIWNQPGKEAYPIAAYTYIIVYRDLSYLKDENKAKTLVDFITWATHDGEKLALEMDYAPLSEGVQKQVDAVIGTLEWNGKAMKPVAMEK
ncbi:MAG TPA: phosphate ABC transporter substrate-binding protein PstS [Tepidisphaeraceae bacterium]|jgi:phosphate transport system substrate-binding protein